MNKLKIFILALSLGMAGLAGAANGLVLNEIHQTEGPGKPLNLRVEEVSRNAKTSAVDITFVFGASVASSMFIMRTIYDIAQARGDRYFVKLSERSDGNGQTHMQVGFSKEKVVNIDDYYQTAGMEGLARNPEQLDTSMFDLIFKKRPTEAGK